MADAETRPRVPAENETGVTFGNLTTHGFAAQFGLASVGTVIFIITPQILLLYFLTSVLAVPPGWAGFALLLPKLFEFVADLTIGRLSDRWVSRFGRRLPFMAIGAIVFPLAFAALFAPPSFADWRVSLGWVMAVSLVATLAYTLFSIPYITMVGEMSDRPADRVRVTAWRMACVSIGVLVAGGIAPAIVDAAGSGRTGYAVMGAALAGISGIATFLALPAAWRLRTPNVPAAQNPTRHVLHALVSSPAYMRTWLSYVLQMAGVSVNAALLPFAVTFQLGASESLVSEIFVAMTIATLAAMPLAVVVARRIGAVSALIASIAISGVGTAAMIAGTPSLIAVSLTAAFVFGAGQAGATALPFALLPEAAATGDAQIAADNAGLFTAIWVAGEKLGLALGGALAGGLLALTGFVSAAQVQSPNTLGALPWLFGGVPAVLFALSIGPLLPLTRSKLNRKGAA